MADRLLDPLPKSALPEEPATRKRAHSYSRLTTAIAVLALATAAYALFRLDSTRDRLDRVNDLASTLAADRTALQAELRSAMERERQTARELGARLDALNALPKQVQDLSAAVEDLHGRTEGPQRAWSRAEALFLMDIAQRSLVLDRDVATAIAALESADSRLASVRDPALTSVRQQLAADLQSLRNARVPDRTGLLTRLAAAETQSSQIPIRGLLAVERASSDDSVLPEGVFARARAMAGDALASLLRVRKVDERSGTVVTQDEEMVRRQHLQLLLFAAHSAVARHDQAAYRAALASARRWLGDYFDLQDRASQALLNEIQLLESVEIEPRLPSISKSAEALQRLMPRGGA